MAFAVSSVVILNEVKDPRILLNSKRTHAALGQAFGILTLLAALSFGAPPAQAQPPAPSTAAQPADSEIPPPTGKVLFSRDANAQPAPQPTSLQATPPNPATPTKTDPLAVTDSERSALTFTTYDLDVHLAPATSAISVRAGLTLRNDAAAPLTRLILQISSSLHWDAISARSPTATTPLPFAARPIETDADHTGWMTEAVVTLPHPLAPGAELTLTALYSGTISPSAERLERIGAPADQAQSADWDSIAATTPDAKSSSLPFTALRGFGNVLWYPVSAPPVFLGDANKLFQAVGSAKLRESLATVRLRLAVEYTGDPPDAAFFNGRREQLIAISDNPNVPAAEAPGVATATFAARPIGFRTLNLFVTPNPATDTGTSANPDLIAAVTDHYDALPAYAAAAMQVEPLLTDWLGPQPLTPLTILDHPGQPFEDDALLVRPMRAVNPDTLVPSLVHSLTHAWVHSNYAWIDEGLAQFTSLLWTERTAGRSTALMELQNEARTLALAEPETPATSSSSTNDSDQPSASPSPGASSQSLIASSEDVFYRTKAVAVWWMLRTMVGDDALKQALQAYRLDPRLDRDPTGFEQTLAKFSHKDLRWFFNDWVYRDRGLPDLSIVSVTPSPLETHNGLPAGWLVAIVVHNDGYAETEVPITVRSGKASETQRLRIPARTSVSTRIVFAGAPELVEVNDGGVPETQTSLHTRDLVLPHH